MQGLSSAILILRYHHHRESAAQCNKCTRLRSIRIEETVKLCITVDGGVVTHTLITGLDFQVLWKNHAGMFSLLLAVGFLRAGSHF